MRRPGGRRGERPTDATGADRASLEKDRWKSIAPYLDRALDLEPSELAAWMTSLRVEQPELAAELEALLEDRDALGEEGFLEESALAPQPAPTAGPYRLIRALGEGGMGVVYFAEQTEPIRRGVAVKVIKPGLDSANVLRRFAAERQTLANLDHPGISKVYDAGTTPDGRPYVAMEYVPGSALTTFCDEHRLPVRARLGIFLQVCAAIQHAHQKGVIHRDLKPSNLLVTMIDGRPSAKVIDFGIAKALQPGPEEEMLLTQTGVMLGTTEYMSPEQAGAIGGGVDTRSDVYALGVVLYELLVGARPFEARDLSSSSSPLSLLETIRDKDPPKLTARLLSLQETRLDIAARRGTELRRLVRQVGGELEWITLRALEKEPARRYASPAELAADIERHLKGEPVLAGPPSTLYRIQKLVRRHRIAVGALAVVAASLAVGAVVSTLALLRAVQAEHLSKEQLRDSLLTQARMLTNSGELDRRSRALEGLAKAAAISPGLELRNAAIAALSTPGFRVVRRWNPHAGGATTAWPDAQLERYARANPDGTVSLHSMDDDTELDSLPGGPEVAVTGLFSPDGSWLAVDYRRDLRVWNLTSRTYLSMRQEANSFGFTRDSRWIFTNAGGRIHLLDLASRRELHRSHIGASEFTRPSVHPTEPLFVLPAFGHRGLEVRRTADGSVDRTLDMPELGFVALWSPDGKSLITSHTDFSIRVWDWPSVGPPRLILRFHRAEPTFLATDPSGRWLASSGWGHQVAFFDLRDGRLILSEPGRRVYAAADRPTFLLSNIADWTLIEFEPAVAYEAIAVHELDKGPRDVAFSPDGRWLGTAGWDGIRVLDLLSREVHGLVQKENVICLAFTEDSRELRAITTNRPRAWRLESDPGTGRLRPLPREIPADAILVGKRSVGGISKNGERWITVGKHPRTGRASWIVGRFDSENIETVDGFTPGGSAPELSDDGRWMAWGNWHGRSAGVTRLGGGLPPVEFPAPDSATVAFAPDNRQLAIGRLEDFRFYEIGTWRLLRSMPQRRGRAASFAFTRDSRVCAVSSTDKVKLLDTVTGDELATLVAPQRSVNQLVFGPGDRLLAAASSDHYVVLWDLERLQSDLRVIGLDWQLAADANH